MNRNDRLLGRTLEIESIVNETFIIRSRADLNRDRWIQSPER
jgi:hypothetical protein